VVRSRVVIVVIAALVVLAAGVTPAAAQRAAFTGLLSGHLGAAAGGDVRDWGPSPGASMAVLEESGLGVEVDASYTSDFDNAQFSDSSITVVTLNFVAMRPHDVLRPYVTAGAGAVHVRAAFPPGQGVIGQTDTAWSAGGGVLYMVTEALGFRGDVRYIRQFGRQDTFPLGSNATLNFIRSSFGVTYSWPIQ
jgi:opacity protein-like surface antigen